MEVDSCYPITSGFGGLVDTTWGRNYGARHPLFQLQYECLYSAGKSLKPVEG
jgi:hypothetical protein